MPCVCRYSRARRFSNAGKLQRQRGVALSETVKRHTPGSLRDRGELCIALGNEVGFERPGIFRLSFSGWEESGGSEWGEREAALPVQRSSRFLFLDAGILPMARESGKPGKDGWLRCDGLPDCFGLCL